MVDIFINLLEDVEHELGLGKDVVHNLKKVGDQLRERMHQFADALAKLEKKGWTWTTGPRDLYLHKASSTDTQAKKELAEAGIPESAVHVVH
jgi:hypothetical protein